MAKESIIGAGTEDDKLNAHYQHVLADNRKIETPEKGVRQNPHDAPTNSNTPVGPMHGGLMNWTQMLESMTAILEGMECADASGVLDAPTDQAGGYDEQEVLNQLNDLFTPILVTQGFESDIADNMKSEMESAEVLTERNIIKFDDATRMAQLISVCAILIQKAKNTKKYQMYVKAAQIRNQMKLDMQKEEYDAAKTLAQKYLVHVSSTNNSQIARQAATKLLPETQH
jgi:hypothetical protein